MEDLTDDFNYEMESDWFLAIFPVWLVSAMALQKFFPWTGDVCHGHFPWLQWWERERQVKPSNVTMASFVNFCPKSILDKSQRGTKE